MTVESRRKFVPAGKNEAAFFSGRVSPLLAARTHTERTTMEAAFLESGTNVDKVRGAIRFVSGFWEKEQGTASKGAIPHWPKFEMDEWMERRSRGGRGRCPEQNGQGYEGYPFSNSNDWNYARLCSMCGIL